MTTSETHSPSLPSPMAKIRTSSATLWGERGFVGSIIVIVLLLTALPYLFAYLTAPPDRRFMGVLLDIPDHMQYFAWLREFTHANLAANRQTPEPNGPVFFNLLWWSLGKIGAWTGMEYASLFALLRVTTIVLCLGCVYAFLRLIIADQIQRRITFVLFTFSGGLGVLWIVVKYAFGLAEAPFPFDIYTIEPNTFLILLAVPHFGMALALLIAIFGLVLVAMRERQLRYAVAAGLVALVLGLQHTYDLVTVYAVLGLFGMLIWIRDRRFPTFLFVCGLIIGTISMPPAAYSVTLVNASPIWGKVLEQFDNAGAFTPDPLHLPILLGIPFLLALCAFRPRTLLSKSTSELFIAAWFIAHFGLVYLPLEFQIHLLLGWQVPIAVLATSFLTTRLGPGIAKRFSISPNAAIALLIALPLITNIYLFSWRFIELNRYAPPYYLTTDEVAALDWLEQHADADSVVLSGLTMGQYVAAHSDGRAFLAHWAQTVDFYGKQEHVRRFFDASSSDAARHDLVREFSLTYIIQGQEEHSLGDYDIARSPLFESVFRSGNVTIYRVR